jgi:hypothetical protein
MELCVKAKNGNGAEDQEITIKLPMDTLKSLQENMNRDSRAGLSSYTRNLSPMRPNQSMFEKSGSFSFLKSDTQPINKSFGKFQARNQEEEGIVSINSEEENQEKRSSQIQGLINNKIFTPKFWDVNPGQEKNQDPVLQYDPMMRTEQFRGKGFNFANPGRMSQMSGDNKMGNQDRGNSMFGDNSAFMSNALGKFNKDIEGLFKNKKGVEINTHLNPDNNQVEIVLTPKNDEQPHMIGSNFNRSQNQFSFNGQEFKKKGNNPSMLNGDQLKLGSLVDEIMKKVTGGPQQRPPRASKSIAPSRRSTTEFSGEEAIESERSVRESDQRSDILREVQEMGSKWIKQPEAKNKVPVLPLTQPFNRAPEHSYQQNRRESMQGASEFIDIRDECNRQSGANGQFKHGHSRSNNSETNEMLTFENRFESKDDEESGFGMDDKDEFKNSKEKTSNQNMYTLAPQEEKRPERKDNIFGMNGPMNNRGLDVKQSNVSGSQAQQRNNFEFKDNRATNASPVSPKYQMTEKISMAFTSIPKPSENPRPAKPETSIPVQAPTPKQQVESSYMKQANIPKQDCIQRSPIAKSQPEAQEYNRQQNASSISRPRPKKITCQLFTVRTN